MWPYVLIFAGGVMAVVGFALVFRARRLLGLTMALEEWQQVRRALAGRVS